MKNYLVEISSGTVWRILFMILAVWFFYTIKEIALLFFISIVIVSAASQVVDRLENRRIPRTLSTLFLYAFFFFSIGYLISLILPVLSIEVKQFGQNIPLYIESLSQFFSKFNIYAANYKFEVNTQNFIDNISSNIASSGSQIFSNTVSFVGGFFKIFVVFSLSFYMLVRKNAVGSFIKTIIPIKHQSYAIDLTKRIQMKMGRWLVGQAALILLIFALDYLALTALGVPYALILAIMGGLLEIIPYIGPTVALIPAALVGLTVSPLISVLVIILYIFIQQLENYLIAPLVMKKAVGLNPVVIILALLIGAELAGVIGIILAVPIATAIDVFLGDIFVEQQINEEKDIIETKPV
jgi:predicted PurR-regulated permease PerM